jgi:muramoyltetrapeptide carboxypeptidase
LTDPPIQRPARLRPGDTVGVVAPAGVIAAERLAAGTRVLEDFGLRVVTGEAVLARRGFLAGPDAARLADVQRMLDDDGVRAVLCARGGYGSQRIVPSLDLTSLRRAPKPVVGFSDVTALLAAVVDAGVVAFHGPMVAADLARGLGPSSREHFFRLLTDPDYRWRVPVPATVRPGRARGRLVGGCLSVLASLLGTRWAPRFDGAILFLEDVHEPPYRLDRLLLQLRQAGALAGVAGVVFGTMAGCRPHDDVCALDVVRDALGDAAFPVGFGLPAGHDPAPHDVENLALPLGAVVELDTVEGCLGAFEPAVG